MKTLVRTLAVLPSILPVLMAGMIVVAGHAQVVTEIGGQKIVNLTRKAIRKTKP